MELTVRKKYLVFSVNTCAKSKVLCLSTETAKVYEINIRLDAYAPDFYAYIDVSRFQGLKLRITVSPEMEVPYRESDDMDIPGLYREPMRPQVHFSTKNGWLNDPNGLIWLDGDYHMFYQYNPAGNRWDNMHWGHAVSRDLVHWEEQDIALFLTDGDGNIFSGSAVPDKKNLLGLAAEGEEAALLYYTVTTKPFTQHLSYSVDGFKTIRSYGGNPVVPHIVGGNRDPKVVFCEELGAYVMALYLIQDEYGLLSSENLTDWKLFQKIRFPGEAECPDLFPMRDSSGRKRWILMGANDHYMVGEFREEAFVRLQGERALHYGSAAYAGQTFSNLPDGRVVRIVWDRWYSQLTNFNGQMGIPMELTLLSAGAGYQMCANPVKELETLIGSKVVFEDMRASSDREIRVPLEDKAYLVKLKGAYAAAVQLRFEIFGCAFLVDFEKNQIVLGEDCCPVSIIRNGFDLTLLIDRCSMEIFMDGGRAYLSAVTEHTICDRNLPWFRITAQEEYCFERVTLYALESIWS